MARATPRSLLYALDIELRNLLKPALRGGHSPIEMYGTTVDLPGKLDFTTLEEMRSYVNTKILGNPHLTAIYGNVPYVRVVQSKYQNRSQDRKSTRLNSSHVAISYAVFCLKKKKIQQHHRS